MSVAYTALTLDDIDPTWRASGRWRQGAALGTVGGMTLPVQAIYVHHTVSPDTGNVVRDVAGPCDTDQANFGKVSYSFNVHESTNSVIEVEGTHRGAHTIDGHDHSLNGVSFGFGVIGNFHPAAPLPPPRRPSDALIRLLAEAIVVEAINPGYAAADVPILGHRDSGFATACCGDWLYARLPDVRSTVTELLHPTSEGSAMAAGFKYGTDLDAVWVTDKGELVTRWFHAGKWNRQVLGTGCKPGASPDVVEDALGQPGRLDVFVDATGGLGHAWFSNESGTWKWAFEVLA